MNDCISCELPLPGGVQHCPACGTDQAVPLAKVDEARCSLHGEAQATGTCARCGRFMCVACSAVDAGVCRGCVELVHRDVIGRYESLMVWRFVAQSSPLEREVWLLRKP